MGDARSRALAPENAAAQPLDGPAKAALFLLSCDEKLATMTIEQMRPEEVAMLVESTRELTQPTREQLAQIHDEFRKLVLTRPLHVHGREDYLERIIQSAFGEHQARRMLAPPDAEPEPEPPNLDHADARLLGSALANEHPQVIAAIVGHLAPDRSVEVLRCLDDDLRQSVVVRLARLDKVPRDSLKNAEAILSAGLPTATEDSETFDGVRAAASVLNRLDEGEIDEILEGLSQVSETLVEDIRRAMFTFEDLVALDRRGMQTLLKEVANERLLMAMKTASEELKEQILGSLSKRAAQMLRDDLEVMGPARLSDVETAQQEIVSVASQLRADGRITIAGQGGEDFV